MIELALNNVCKYYGANKVFDNITFEVQTGERLALIGRNGTGKTTIFKIIAGIEEIEKHDGGVLSIRKDATIGYLDQIPSYPETYKVSDVLNTAFKQQYDIKESMNRLEKEMATVQGTELDKIMKKYGELQLHFEHHGGYEIEEKLSKISTGLKISNEFMEREFSILSGGEKTTIMLGKILLEGPDILLLDEPSNHLDIESIEWLEEFLKEYKGTVLIISHDRYFLDRVITRVVEIEDGEISTYLGNYSYYVDEKERRMLEQFEAFKEQQKKIKAMEDAIKRFRDWGTRADNEAMFKKAASMQKRIDKMNKIDKPIFDRAKIQVNFSGKERSGKDVIRVKDLRKSFEDNLILRNLELHVRYGEKLAIIGKNGSGKSTFLNILLGHLEADGGEVELGSRVKIGHLEQNISFENESHTVLEAFRDKYTIAEGMARGILAKFLFYGGDVFKKVGSLSGGEKVRLKLCILMQEDINLLILDEPTNHLDIDSREMLEEALEEFNGTIVFISHDRYFINRIGKRIIEFRDREAYDYLGNYEYYREKKIQEKSVIENLINKEKTTKIKIVTEKPVDEEKRKEKMIVKLEEEIQKLEDLIKAKDNEMELHANDHQILSDIYSQRNMLQKDFEDLLEEWVLLNE